MSTQITTTEPLSADIIERVLIGQDLSKLEPEQRIAYYKSVCDSLSLNPLTRPFAYIQLNGKLTLYALKDCTEQLRKRDGVSIAISSREVTEGVYVVLARATNKEGRADESIGAVPIEGLKGEARANAFMKCETKAKRRVTLSICGLGMLDETEVGSIPGAVITDPESIAKAIVDKHVETGEEVPLPANQESALEAKREELKKQIADKEAKGESPGKAVETTVEPPQKPAKTSKGKGTPKTTEAPQEPTEAQEQPSGKQPAWQDYTIAVISHEDYLGKKLIDLSVGLIFKLKSGWVDKFFEKNKLVPERKLESDMIEEAFRFAISLKLNKEETVRPLSDFLK